jgi:integrase
MRGSIKNIGKNKWRLVFDLQPTIENGKPRRNQKKLVFNGTKTQAEEKLNALINSVENGTYVKDDNMTVAQYLPYWLERHKKLKKISNRTYDSYKQTIEQHLIPIFGCYKLSDLKPKNIDDYYYSKDEKLSSTTLLYHHRVLSMALKQAVKWDMLSKNPCDKVTIPSKDSFENNQLTPGQVYMLLTKTIGLAIHVPIALAAFTGARRGEVCALRWDDIDFENKVIWIRHSMTRVDGKLTLKSTKTKKIRCVAMADYLHVLLKNHKETQEAWDNAANINREFVCCWEDGRPFDLGYVSRQYTKAVKLLEPVVSQKTRFHDLRHNFASYLLDAGQNPQLVADMLGHDMLTTMFGTYTHTNIEMQRKAIQCIENKYRGEELQNVYSITQKEPVEQQEQAGDYWN